MAGLKALAEVVLLLAANGWCFSQRLSLVCGLQLASNTSTRTKRYLGGCEQSVSNLH
jgi:hypothetical protein